jgi:hypothetical protein
MRVRIVRTQIKIWMLIWLQELQELEVETLTCQLRGVVLRFNNMWVQELLYLHKTYRIAAWACTETIGKLVLVLAELHRPAMVTSLTETCLIKSSRIVNHSSNSEQDRRVHLA